MQVLASTLNYGDQFLIDGEVNMVLSNWKVESMDDFVENFGPIEEFDHLDSLPIFYVVTEVPVVMGFRQDWFFNPDDEVNLIGRFVPAADMDVISIARSIDY